MADWALQFIASENNNDIVKSGTAITRNVTNHAWSLKYVYYTTSNPYPIGWARGRGLNIETNRWRIYYSGAVSTFDSHNLGFVDGDIVEAKLTVTGAGTSPETYNHDIEISKNGGIPYTNSTPLVTSTVHDGDASGGGEFLTAGARHDSPTADISLDLIWVKYEDLDTPANNQHWVAASSDHSNTGSQPVLIEVLTGNHATAVNMNTDGSEWIIVKGTHTTSSGGRGSFM